MLRGNVDDVENERVPIHYFYNSLQITFITSMCCVLIYGFERIRHE